MYKSHRKTIVFVDPDVWWVKDEKVQNTRKVEKAKSRNLSASTRNLDHKGYIRIYKGIVNCTELLIYVERGRPVFGIRFPSLHEIQRSKSDGRVTIGSVWIYRHPTTSKSNTKYSHSTE